MFPTLDGLRTLELGGPGNLRQWLVGLVVDGTKKGTAGLVRDYEAEDESIEQVDERLVVVDDEGGPVARVRVTRVDVMRLADVPWEFVAAENEGDASIAEWRAGHEAFWASEGIDVDDDTAVVLVWFDLEEIIRDWPTPRVQRFPGVY